MITAIICDLSGVLLFPKDSAYTGELNPVYKEKSISENFSFSDYFIFNDVLLQYLNELKNKYQLSIFTSGTIQNVPIVKNRLDSIFTKVFSASEIGYSKTSPAAYKYVLEHMDKQPTETIYIDDSTPNLEAAKLTGLHTLPFTNNEEVIKKLSAILSKN